MNSDIRLKVSFSNHRKRKKLQRLLGAEGVLAFIDLMLAAAAHRPNGVFTGYDLEDIAIDAQWDGDAKEFVDTLLAVGLLNETEQGLAIHDWIDHNAYAADAEIRSGEGRFGNLKKYYPHRAAELEAQGIGVISAEDYARIKDEESGIVKAETVAPDSVPDRPRLAPDSPPGRYPSPPAPAPAPAPDPTPDPIKKTPQPPLEGGVVPEKNPTPVSVARDIAGEGPLLEAFLDFHEMRQKIKSPMTVRAVQLLFSRIDSLARTEQEKIKLLEEATMNSWKSVYPPKKPPGNGNGKDGFVVLENGQEVSETTAHNLRIAKKVLEEKLNGKKSSYFNSVGG
ncbi:MAG: hypothetical protein RBR42_04960 [Desulfomicrobium sp.]|nr:hypothetical protein [Desulfomicrobium sp.]